MLDAYFLHRDHKDGSFPVMPVSIAGGILLVTIVITVTALLLRSRRKNSKRYQGNGDQE